VDFGEAQEDKFYVLAEVSRGHTQVEWRQLTGVRPYIDAFVRLEASQPPEGLSDHLRAALPEAKRLADAIVRLTVEYPREWEALIDEQALRAHTAQAFEFHLVKHPQMEARIRLPDNQALSGLNALDLLELYWRANHVDEEELKELSSLAAQVITQPEAELEHHDPA
jgi:exonuclease SbcD